MSGWRGLVRSASSKGRPRPGETRATGESISIPASKQPKFKAGKTLKGRGQRLTAAALAGRAVSSAGRALGLHPRGRRFDPVTAHHAPASPKR